MKTFKTMYPVLVGLCQRLISLGQKSEKVSDLDAKISKTEIMRTLGAENYYITNDEFEVIRELVYELQIITYSIEINSTHPIMVGDSNVMHLNVIDAVWEYYTVEQFCEKIENFIEKCFV